MQADAATTALPAGACDTHTHIFEPARYAYDERRSYTPGPATVCDLRTHLAQRDRDPVDGPLADRCVAVERKAATGLSGEPGREQPHQRSGVADVDRPARIGHAAQARAADDYLVGAAFHERAEPLDRRER